MIESSDQINPDALGQDLAYNLENLNDIMGMISEIREMESEEFQELKRLIEDEEDVLGDLESQDETIRALEQALEQVVGEVNLLETELEEEEEVIDMAERLAEQVKDREDYQRLSEEERIIDDLEGQFKTVLEKRQELEQRLDDIEGEYGNETDQHEEILSGISELEQSFAKAIELVQEIGEIIEQFISETQREISGVGFDTQAQSVYHNKAASRGDRDWDQIQSDFEQSVRVANDIKASIEGYSGKKGIMDILLEMYDETGSLLENVESEI